MADDNTTMPGKCGSKFVSALAIFEKAEIEVILKHYEEHLDVSESLGSSLRSSEQLRQSILSGGTWVANETPRRSIPGQAVY